MASRKRRRKSAQSHRSLDILPGVEKDGREEGMSTDSSRGAFGEEGEKGSVTGAREDSALWLLAKHTK